jgi:hypothetical protein
MDCNASYSTGRCTAGEKQGGSGTSRKVAWFLWEHAVVSSGELMQLIQILLPLNACNGTSRELINEVREDLTLRFGGLTLYYRNAPAEGLWEYGDTVEKDAIIVAEVMTAEPDRDCGAATGRRFQQDEIVIRAIPIIRL